MRYSIEPRNKRYVKGYGFLSFARNIGKNISNKYSQKFVDSAIKSGATKIADKITSVSKKSKELPQNETSTEKPKERYISPKERQQIIDELRLI